MERRRFLSATGGLAAASLAPGARAQAAYPSKPVTLIWPKGRPGKKESDTSGARR